MSLSFSEISWGKGHKRITNFRNYVDTFESHSVTITYFHYTDGQDFQVCNQIFDRHFRKGTVDDTMNPGYKLLFTFHKVHTCNFLYKETYS